MAREMQQNRLSIILMPIPSAYRLQPLHQPTLLGDTRELGGHEWSGPIYDWLAYLPIECAIICHIYP